MKPDTLLSSQRPWPGLRSFSETDHDFFFGRGHETSELLTLVQRSPVVVLHGQSGLGKTSLLQAGLFPALRDASFLPFTVRLDHSETAPALDDQVKTALTAALDATNVTGPRPSADETLWEYFHRRDLDLWGPRNRLLQPVIVLDQFEETFTLGQRSVAAGRRVAEFAGDLEALLEHRAPEAVRNRLERNPDSALQYDLRREAVKLVITLREDFLAQLDTWRGRMPSLLPARFRLERMTGTQALEVVEGGGQDLVDTQVAGGIVDFVSGSQRRTQIAALEQRRVEPALLSVVLDELNRRRIERNQPRITADLLTGEREGIIQAFYDRAFDDVDPRVRDWIEDYLLTSSGYRDRAALEDARKMGVPESAFDRLVDRRILHREERDGVVWLELTHDLLTDPATNSRTQRDQRRQAEESKQREAEISKRLRRTTQLAGVFGVLFLAAVAALVYAGMMSKRASDMRTQVAQERDKALTAEGAAKTAATLAQSAETLAKAEAGRAAASRDTTLGIADRQANLLLDNVRDMRTRTLVVLNFITSTDDSFRSLGAQSTPTTAENESYAAFLVRAAEALYQVGHIKDGLAYATRGLSLFDERGLRGTPKMDSLHAEALYARGQGRLQTNRLAEARSDFQEALAQAAAITKGGSLDARDRNEMRRVRALAELGLGEIEARRLATAAASAHFERVLGMVPAANTQDAEGLFWRVIAARQLGQLLSDGDRAERWLAVGAADLQTLNTMLPGDLRVARLSAELNYARGRNADNLGRSWIAEDYLQRAKNASDTLSAYDPDNRDWALNAARVRRGTAILHRIRNQMDQAVEVLRAGVQGAAEMARAEPEWRSANYLHGALSWDLADLLRLRAAATPEVTLKHDEAMTQMQQAQRLFLGIKGRTAGDLETQRAVALAIGGIALVQYELRHHDEAIRLYKEAIDTISSAEKTPQVDVRIDQNKGYFLRMIALSYEAQKNWTEAETAHTQAISILSPLATRTRLPDDYAVLVDTTADYADMLISAGRPDAAAIQYDIALAAANRSLAIEATHAATSHAAARVLIAQSSAQARRGDTAEAGATLRNAGRIVSSSLARWPADGPLRVDLSTLALQAAAIGLDQFRTEFDLSRMVTWIMPPMMPGAWRNLSGAQLTGAVEMASEALGGMSTARFSAARALTLEFRPVLRVESNATVPGGFDYRQLIEVGVYNDDGSQGLVTLMTTKPLAAQGIGARRGAPYVLLEGTSDVVHKMNLDAPPLLDTQAQASSYFYFFMAMLHGDLGPFTVVERPEDLRWEQSAPLGIRATTGKAIQPARFNKQADGTWQVDANMIYAATLFRAKLKIPASGVMEMLDDEPLSEDLPIRIDAITNRIRVSSSVRDLLTRRVDELKRALERNPSEPKALADLAELSAKLERWADAAAAKQQLVSWREPMAKPGNNAYKDLAADYTALSWYRLLARDYKGALAAAEAGLKYDRAYELLLESNRAHALLFLGRVKEAEAIYRAHIGKRFQAGGTLTWQQAVLADFDKFERAGLKHPDIQRIRTILR